MSFPSSVYPSDYADYKKKYMDMLNLQISINKKVFDAVTLKNRTGQLPIAPQDYRSIEEKYADVLGLQRQLSTNLGTITDAQNLALIMADLIKNPPLMNFIIMSFPAISEYMKKNYSIGVKYPIFMSYVEKMYRDAEKAVTDTLSDRVNQIEIFANQEDLNRLKQLIIQTPGINNLNKGNLVRIIDILSKLMLSPNDITQIKKGKKILSNTMLEAYKKVPLRTSPDNKIKTIQYFEDEIKVNNVPDEDEFTRDLYNILDDAVLAITLSKSGSRYETPELLQKEADDEIEAQRIEAERIRLEQELIRIETEQLKLEKDKKTEARRLKLKQLESDRVANLKQQKLLAVVTPVATIPQTTTVTTVSIGQKTGIPNLSSDEDEITVFVKDIKSKAELIRFSERNNINTLFNQNTIDSNIFKKSNNDPARDEIIKQILIALKKNGKPVDLSTERTVTISSASPTQGTLIPSIKTGGIDPQTGLAQTSTGEGFGDITHSRFNILKGEVLAGNNSRVLINELIRHIHKMVQNKTVDYNQAMKSIDELNNLV